MIAFLARRLAFALFLVFAVSSASLLLAKLAPGDLVEWPDSERGTVIWISEDGERFRVEGLLTLRYATDSFRVVRSGRLDVPIEAR